MFQTLFHIPHELGGVTVFGLGWALLAWAVFSISLLAYLVPRRGFDEEVRAYLPVLALFALAILFVLPALEETGIGADGSQQTLGVPIRGYGTLLLIAVVAGMATATYRAHRAGVNPDLIYSLALWMFLWAIIGARVFYVVQKWDQFQSGSWVENAVKIVKLTEGGLVVYGAFVAALVSGTAFLIRRGLPVLAIGDLIAPSLVLGLAIGRIGCLMNGCCYGGLCDLPWKISFPQRSSSYSLNESPPYEHQHRLGILHGIRLSSDEHNRPLVREIIESDGPAARAGLRPGDQITSINGYRADTYESAQGLLAQSGPTLTVTTGDDRTVAWSVGELPPRSRPVHPTQIYSAINAAILFLFLTAYYPFRQRDGEVVALLLTIYPVTRFLLEIIRRDEGAIFGTGMTISQNVSVMMLIVVGGLWIYVLRQPRRSVVSLNTAPIT